MKEYAFDQSTFMGAWFIPEKVCDEVLDFFDKEKENHEPGKVYGFKEEDGNLVDANYVNPESKKCMQISVDAFPPEMHSYGLSLAEALDNYLKKYDWANNTCRFAIEERVNVQHYKPGEGFYTWHMENDGNGSCNDRHLVFMTYLNDVENGGTEFYYYPDLNIQARKGLTLIWPAGWTHTHKGVISNVEEKTIVTGWYSFYDI
tara:strand:- start:1909 stop:2517 length:609 start_codon:yes stop_codon:yes gene_type:complete